MYNNVKFLSLVEESCLLFKKTTKKIWIIAMIISVLSGGFIIDETVDDSFYPETAYDDTVISEGTITLGQDTAVELVLIVLGVVLMIGIVLIIGVLINSAWYYLYKSIYEILNHEKIERAPLELVVKVSSIVVLKIILGLILFVVPGIIIGLKYAPLNYILCKNPELSSKEILNKTKVMSDGIKWKILVFTILISLISGLIVVLISPNLLVQGYICLDIFTSILKFIVSTIMVVFTGFFSMNLFIAVDNIKYKKLE